jgi:hypothetical protein
MKHYELYYYIINSINSCDNINFLPGEEIVQLAINGPREDHTGGRDTHFLNANGAEAAHENAYTILESTKRLAGTHTNECLKFYFSMPVRNSHMIWMIG